MDASVLKVVGQVAGIAGLALGVFLLLFREIIRRTIFPKLPPDEAFRFLRLIIGAVWTVALAGIAAWVLAGNVTANCGVAVGHDVSGSTVTNKCDNNPK